jgi:hypothetical protein
MLNCSYDGIEFQCMTVNQYSQELVHSDDGVQPLYWKHSMSFNTLLNPATTPWANLPVPGPGGLFGAQVPPGLALILLRQRLQVPRKKLKVWYAMPGGVTNNILESPLPVPEALKNAVTYDSPQDNPTRVTQTDFEVDATDGPHCKVIWTKDEASEGSLIVGLEFETCVPLCHQGYSPLISNRFTMAFNANEDYFLTRTISGEAVFRADVMNIIRYDPFALRKSFLIMPPGGYKRSASVQFDSSNTSCQYEIQDTELPMSWPGCAPFGVTRVEAIQSREYITPTFWG